MARKVVIHYVVPSDKGAIVSGPGPDLPLGAGTLGKGGRFFIACKPDAEDNLLGTPGFELGSGETWACDCPECMKTAEYKRDWKPNPRVRDAREEAGLPALEPPK